MEHVLGLPSHDWRAVCGSVIVDLHAQPPDPQPSDLDLKVLAHLRGYPDELRRFSNLIKQAHPRGKSAVEFYLSREVAGDSFLATLCRFVQAGEDIATVVEAAALLGQSPAQMLEAAARPGFPPPLAGTGRHQVWRRADLVALASDSPRIPLSEG